MTSIKKVFEVKDTGDLTWCLGTAIHQDLSTGTVSIDQSLYIEEMIQTYLPQYTEGGKVRIIPCNESIQDLKADTPESETDPRYRRCIGKLLWLAMVSRPDLAYTISMLAHFNHCGGAAHMQAVFQAMKYAYATRHYRLRYSAKLYANHIESVLKNSGLKPEAMSTKSAIMYSDSSHGGPKPMAGYVMMFFGGPTSWSAYRHTMTSLSSAEGEYVGATRATVVTISARRVFEFLTVPDNAPTVLLCDNTAAISLSESNPSARRLKHIHTRIAFLREAVEEKHVQLHHIRTDSMLADIFTKPLAANQFHHLRAFLVN